MDVNTVIPNMVVKTLQKMGTGNLSSALNSIGQNMTSKTVNNLQAELDVLANKAKSGINQTINLKSMDDALKVAGYSNKTRIISDAYVSIPRAIPASEQIEKFYSGK